ncbi:hypothetical protein [Streptomyces sp. NPDC051364]
MAQLDDDERREHLSRHRMEPFTPPTPSPAPTFFHRTRHTAPG